MAVDLEKLTDSPHLLDLLIQMEDVLDSLDCYVFKNWIDGEIVDGPKVRRYWLDMTLKFPYDKMPDPRAGLRLLKHGIRVDYSKANEESGKKVDTGEDEEDKNVVWFVRISIPRRLIVEINAGELDFYDDEVDIEDVEDAQDSGMSDEAGYVDPEQGGNAPDEMGGDFMGGPEGAEQGGAGQQPRQGGANGPA